MPCPDGAPWQTAAADEPAYAAAVAAMTAYKRPRLSVTLPEVPRNSIGKIVRRR